MGSAFFTKWSSAEDNGNCQGHYEERKRALCGTENVCHTRLYILIFSWDFRGCQTLPFLRGQTMPRFPQNKKAYSHSMLVEWLLLYEVGLIFLKTQYIVLLFVLYHVLKEKLVKSWSCFREIQKQLNGDKFHGEY